MRIKYIALLFIFIVAMGVNAQDYNALKIKVVIN